MTVEDDQRPPQHKPLWDRIWSGISIQTVIQSAGFLFVLVAAFGFAYAVLKLISSTAASPPVSSELFWQNLVSNNIQVIAIVLIAFLSALFALRLFSKAGSLTSEVIREKDRPLLQPLITAANKEAIDQYIRLASLSGFRVHSPIWASRACRWQPLHSRSSFWLFRWPWTIRISRREFSIWPS